MHLKSFISLYTKIKLYRLVHYTMSNTEEHIIIVYKSYTPKQNKFIYTWRRENKDYVDEYARNLRKRQIEKDPDAYKAKRTQYQRNYYAKQRLRKRQESSLPASDVSVQRIQRCMLYILESVRRIAL